MLFTLTLAVVAALAGSVAVVVPLVAAAVIALVAQEDPVATWALLTAAALPFVGFPVRRLALPLVGLGAVLVSASASNGAAVLPAWLLGSACAAVAATGRPDSQRWRTALFATDLPVVGAVAVELAADGAVRWSADVAPISGGLLLAAALGRAALAAGPSDRAPAPGLLVVRIQLAVIAVWLVGSEVAVAAVVAGGILAAVVGLLRRPGPRDAVHEAGVLLVVAGAVGAGWASAGWIWIALGGGTLLHLVRLVGDERDAAGVVRDATRTGPLVIPLLPATIGAAAATASAASAWAAVGAVGLLVALGGRAAAAPSGLRVFVGRVAPPVRWFFPALAVVLTLWATPWRWSSPAGVPVTLGLSPWGLALVVAGGAAGAVGATLAAPAGRRRQPHRAPGLVGGPVASWTAAVAEIPYLGTFIAVFSWAAAATVWAWSWSRGFL